MICLKVFRVCRIRFKTLKTANARQKFLALLQSSRQTVLRKSINHAANKAGMT